MFGIGVRPPSQFELKIFSWIFYVSIIITLFYYLIISQTDIKKCQKLCKNKGFNHTIYIPSDKYGIREPECKCCNKVKENGGTYFKDCEDVNLNQ